MSISRDLGIEFSIFAFSHCRDVVAAVSKAGGYGVLGAAYMTPDQLDMELAWIDAQVDGAPYGVDVIIPEKYEESDSTESDHFKKYEHLIPDGHRQWVQDTLDRLGVPPAEEDLDVSIESFSRELAEQQIEVSLSHSVSLIVNALGTPPREVVDRVKGADMRIGALAGRVRHAERHAEAGLDLIVAQGAEAAGHVNDVTTMVLVPDVVDAVRPIPVLAAGGIGTGRQIAAARALGASGVWTGSIWLTTAESDVLPEVQHRYLNARSEDAVVGYEHSGKPNRKLRSKWTQAWKDSSAPATLPMPLQGVLVAEAEARIRRAKRWDLVDAPVGQIVSRMSQRRSAREVLFDLVNEYVDVIEGMRSAW